MADGFFDKFVSGVQTVGRLIIPGYDNLRNATDSALSGKPLDAAQYAAAAGVEMGTAALLGPIVGKVAGGIAGLFGKAESTVANAVVAGSDEVATVAAKEVTPVASEGAKTGVLANKAAGDTVSDAIAARYPGARREITLQARDGGRRVDVLTPTLDEIESKVGRTSLTDRTKQEATRSAQLVESGDLKSSTWEFTRSGITGKIGPTPTLRKFLTDLGIKIKENN